MIGADRDAIVWLNAFVGRAPDFDRWVAHVAFNDLFKGAIPLTCVWWLWFSGSGDQRKRRRSALAACLVFVVFALGLNRLIASLLPHTQRPLQAVEGFIPPGGVNPNAFSDLSAFPSDHAVMFIGIATGVLVVSRLAGIGLLLHAVLVVLLPRLYLGLHWPTDVIVGGAFGAVTAWIATRSSLGGWAGRPLIAWEIRHPPSFYALLFFLTWQLATLFVPIVKVAEFVTKGP